MLVAQTLVEKVTQRYAVDLPEGFEVHALDFVAIRPEHVMTHDNTGAVIPKFRSIGATSIRNPDQPVICLDHDVQNRSDENLEKYRKIEEFARQHGIAFFPAGSGIGHQIMVEQGFVRPGSFVVASDSHSNLYGAVGAVGTPVVRTDAAAIWATGKTWWQVPEIVKVQLSGRLPQAVTGKDLIIALCGHFANDDVLNCAIEFDGEGVASLAMEQRMTITNMTTEWGALAGCFPFDAVTAAYLRQRARILEAQGTSRLTEASIAAIESDPPRADPGAHYSKAITFDLSSLTPHVAGPNEVKTITRLADIESRDIRIQRAYLLSCVNGRLGDFAEAASVMAGKKIAAGVRLYIAAASAEIEVEARRCGYWAVLLEAGATALPPGCGACIGLGEGLLEDGEVGISATNRNFKGRMGSSKADVYLASPAVVAASALAGRICGPRPFGNRHPRGTIEVRKRPVAAGGKASVSVVDGFPTAIRGRILFVPKDNLNTDGIYGKDYTYKDKLTPDEMARVAMLNYDPEFQQKVQAGDILVGGRNFGTGSSREQAATALKFRGVRLIIAASFSQTYSRNAFNNGYICLDCPEFADEIARRFADRAITEKTIVTGLDAIIDFAEATIRVADRTWRIPPLLPAMQRLVALGGAENLVRQEIANDPARRQ